MAVPQIRQTSGARPEALAGSAKELQAKLKASQREHFVLFELASADKDVQRAWAEAVATITPLILGRIAERKRDSYEKIVDALVSSVPLPKHLVKEAQMMARAKQATLDSAEWLTAAQLSQIAGFTSNNASAQPNKWKREGKIFAIQQNGVDYYPDYALDGDAQYRPVKGLAPILEAFKDRLNGWETAIWFASLNSFLNGARPQDLLKGDPDWVLAAANDEVVGVRHG